MADQFSDRTSGLDSPALGFYAITPHDSTDVSIDFRSIYVGGAGNVVVVPRTGSAVTFVAVPAGSILPVRGKRVNSTSTTATSLVGLY